MDILKSLKKNWCNFEKTLFPEYKCIICGQELNFSHNNICEKCYAELDFIGNKVCKRCGEKLEGNELVCKNCINVKYNFDRAFSVCVYDNKSSSLVKNLKYNGKKYIAKHMASFLAELFNSHNLNADYLTFVPMTSKRQKERGFNQSELLAKSLSKILNIPCVPLIERIKDSKNQASLNREERQNNLKDCFLSLKNNDIVNKDVILIDDVFTTGATANECCGEIKKLKPKSICVLTFAKTQLNVL